MTRTRDPRDRRRVLVERTTLGATTYAAVQSADVAEELVRGPLEDTERFRAELVRLVAALGADG